MDEEKKLTDTANEEEQTLSESVDTSGDTMEDISSVSKKKKRKGKIFLVIVSVFLVLVLASVCAGNMYINYLLNQNINKDESYNEENLAINSDAFKDDDDEEEKDDGSLSSDYINIALFGVDSRGRNFTGRSDTMIVMTIDKKRNKIKLTSIARDSYVHIDGHNNDKLTHAYAYGRAELAVRTLNQNFNLNIKDYVTVNFFGFIDMIDYIGGVDVNVNASELAAINAAATENPDGDFEYVAISGTGMQHLNGAQALYYARTRHNTGGDLGRAGRQRAVLNASLKQAREMGISKLPDLIKMGLQNCQTSLDTNEIKELATWALLNSPTIETYAVPDSDCHPKSGKDCYIGQIWYYIYDLNIATQKIHDFIKEEGTYEQN